MSREFTVHIGNYDRVAPSDAVSREFTVHIGNYNRVEPSDAVSREFRAYGNYDRVAPGDAVSREFTVHIGNYDRVEPGDAVSRELVHVGNYANKPRDAVSREFSVLVPGPNLIGEDVHFEVGQRLLSCGEALDLDRGTTGKALIGPWTEELYLADGPGTTQELW